MRIVHLGDHSYRDNQDEQAITHAFRELGHMVLPIQDTGPAAARSVAASVMRFGPDFLLTHKSEPEVLAGLKCLKCVWNFDLVESDDWVLTARSAARLKWAADMLAVVDLFFITDGDFVAKDTTGKCHWLMQGADERVTGSWGTYPGEGAVNPPSHWDRTGQWTGDILFCGSTIHGGKRMTFVDEMKERWGNRFLAFGHRYDRRLHGRELAHLMAAAKVVVCPDGPVTDRYCSNRLVQACGFGACVLHPDVEVARLMYMAGGYAPYLNRKYLHEQIESLLSQENDDVRRGYRELGHRETVTYNLYRHRCAELVDVVRAKLGVG